MTASSSLQAAPCLPLCCGLVPRWSSWGSREPCTGTAGSRAGKGGKGRKIGLVSTKTAPLRASLRKNPGKGENMKKVLRMSEARWLSCLVRWKPATVLCLTVRCENNPRAKPVRVALVPKKALSYSICVVKQDLQSVCERQCSAAWLQEGRQERWCFGMHLWGIFSALILQDRAQVSAGGPL